MCGRKQRMTEEWWWLVHGNKIRVFKSEAEAEVSLNSSEEAFLIDTGEGWSINLNKSEITIVKFNKSKKE